MEERASKLSKGRTGQMPADKSMQERATVSRLNPNKRKIWAQPE